MNEGDTISEDDLLLLVAAYRSAFRLGCRCELRFRLRPCRCESHEHSEVDTLHEPACPIHRVLARHSN